MFRLLGWKIKTLRLAKELTQEELAFRVGAIDQAYISELEHGKGNPTLQIMYDLSQALETPLSDLFSTDGAPKEVIGQAPRKRNMNALK